MADRHLNRHLSRHLGHPLIDGYLAELARRLPTDIVDELADGLAETYRHHLQRAGDRQAAARHALAEFGDAGQILAAFTRQSPGARTALLLLATGPAVGGCWATALIFTHAWAWPIPLVARAGLGVTLLMVLPALLIAALGDGRYGRTRIMTLTGGVGLLGLDAVMLAGATLAAPAVTWPLAIAAVVSLARIGLVVRALPRIIAS